MKQAPTDSGFVPQGFMAFVRFFLAALLIATGPVCLLGPSGLVDFSPAFAQEDDEEYEDEDDEEEDYDDEEEDYDEEDDDYGEEDDDYEEDDEEDDEDAARARGEVDHSGVVVDSSLWVLDFHVGRVASITMLEGPFKGRIFWYMTYTVENKSETARNAYLSITAESDRRKRYADIHLGSVERAVERKVGRPLWGKSEALLAKKDLDPTDAAYHYSEFKPGEKRESVAVFGELDPGSNNIKISVRGLSNDYYLIEKEDGDREIEERVYEVLLHRPGDGYAINLDRFIQKKKGWAKKRTKLVIPTGEDDEDVDG